MKELYAVSSEVKEEGEQLSPICARVCDTMAEAVLYGALCCPGSLYRVDAKVTHGEIRLVPKGSIVVRSRVDVTPLGWQTLAWALERVEGNSPREICRVLVKLFDEALDLSKWGAEE